MADHTPSRDGGGSPGPHDGRSRSTTPRARSDSDSSTVIAQIAKDQAQRRRELVRNRLDLTASKTRMMDRHQPFPWAPEVELLNYDDAPACIRLDELAFPYLPHRQSSEKVNQHSFIQHPVLCHPPQKMHQKLISTFFFDHGLWNPHKMRASLDHHVVNLHPDQIPSCVLQRSLCWIVQPRADGSLPLVEVWDIRIFQPSQWLHVWRKEGAFRPGFRVLGYQPCHRRERRPFPCWLAAPCCQRRLSDGTAAGRPNNLPALHRRLSPL
jgi:hypothetical protein